MEHTICLIENNTVILPPTFSRLPPDGDEFPPNFNEPQISIMDTSSDTELLKRSNYEKNLIFESQTAPPLPKSIPPKTTPRKIYRQDFIIEVDDKRFSNNNINQNGINETILHLNNENLEKLNNNCNNNNTSVNIPIIIEDKIIRKAQQITQTAAAMPNIQRKLSLDNYDSITRSSPNSLSLSRKYDLNTLPRKSTSGNWRKDEKSEKSVRDKIAMFSNGEGEGKPLGNKFSFKTKSTENLTLSETNFYKTYSNKNTSNLLPKQYKASSVENLMKFTSNKIIPQSPLNNNIPSVRTEIMNGISKTNNKNNYTNGDSLLTNGDKLTNGYFKPYSKSKDISTPDLTSMNSIPTNLSYNSLPRKANIHPILTRTTSFTGYNGSPPTSDEQRKAKINNLLEQRKKSFTKLRGLIIPEKTTIGDEKLEPVLLDLPEIKNIEIEKLTEKNNYKNKNYNYGKENSTPTKQPTIKKDLYSYQNHEIKHQQPPVYNEYKSIFNTSSRPLSTATNLMNGKMENGLIKKPNIPPPLPPVKPPRTSLIINSIKSPNGSKSVSPYESEDSDSVFGSQISSPPQSPTNVTVEKYPLTRSLSSETNTSIASSTTSTLTSGSGSQASCSSMESTPTVDLSRRITNKSVIDSTNNRRNILASARCRSGRDETSSLIRSHDDDSTDGCEENDCSKTPKPKKRNSLNINNQTNYRLAKPEDLVDKIINIASYVEVVSDNDKKIDNMSKYQTLIKKEPIIETATITKQINKIQTVPNGLNEKRHSMSTFKPEPISMRKTAPKLSTNDIRKSFEAKIQSSTISPPSPISSMNGGSQIISNNLNKIKSLTNGDLHKSKEVKENLTEKISIKTNREEIIVPSVRKSISAVPAPVTTANSNHNNSINIMKSFKSQNDSNNLVSDYELKCIIEEAEPQLETPDVFVIVLKRESPESSIGITLAGGSDYEAKEITIHRIRKNSPADVDGRTKIGDRILSINGQSMKGLTHNDSVAVLKTPCTSVVMVMTRSKSVIVKPLTKSKRSSLGSLSSLLDRDTSDTEKIIKISHKASKSLDLDVLDDAVKKDEKLDSKTDDNKLSDKKQNGIDVSSTKSKQLHNERVVEISKDGSGLGFAIEGGYDSPNGNVPLLVKKVFMGGAAERTGQIKAGDEIIAINGGSTLKMTRVTAWNLMKELPQGIVKITFR